jgi:hypothetical protein
MSAVYLQNKYTRWYYNIIDRARSRQTHGYTERHHIIPRSLGGDNTKNNLVELTAREHFVCHLMLARMTTGDAKKKMIRSVFYLTGKGKAKRNNSIRYENLRIELAKITSQQHKGSKRPPRTSKTKQNLSVSKQGKKNPKFTGYFITPWGTWESSRLAAKNCPTSITANYIIRLCQSNNHKPINLLSVCRSKAYLNDDHIGLTPNQLGFSFVPKHK